MGVSKAGDRYLQMQCGGKSVVRKGNIEYRVACSACGVLDARKFLSRNKAAKVCVALSDEPCNECGE